MNRLERYLVAAVSKQSTESNLGIAIELRNEPNISKEIRTLVRLQLPCTVSIRCALCSSIHEFALAASLIEGRHLEMAGSEDLIEIQQCQPNKRKGSWEVKL